MSTAEPSSYADGGFMLQHACCGSDKLDTKAQMEVRLVWLRIAQQYFRCVLIRGRGIVFRY